MPTISEFFGILIRIYFNDHNPPHFHAIYGEYEAIFCIRTLEKLEGELPKRAKLMVVEWALEHRSDLMANWDRAKNQQPLLRIEPLT